MFWLIFSEQILRICWTSFGEHPHHVWFIFKQVEFFAHTCQCEPYLPQELESWLFDYPHKKFYVLSNVTNSYHYKFIPTAHSNAYCVCTAIMINLILIHLITEVRACHVFRISCILFIIFIPKFKSIRKQHSISLKCYNTLNYELFLIIKWCCILRHYKWLSLNLQHGIRLHCHSKAVEISIKLY